MAQFTFLPAAESADLADDIARLFDDLASSLKEEHRAFSGECHPAIDVLETDESVEVLMDVSGVPPQAIRILYRGDVLIVAGEKAPPLADQNHEYHLVEREFGRFARAVRLKGAFDVPRARATVHEGELAIVLPKLSERRGRAHLIPVNKAGAERS